MESARTVLVVDDEAPVRNIVGQYLARDGFRVVATGDGREVMALVERESPHLVVLDVMLPGINGFEVLRRIRAVSKVSVLMLTARGDDVDRIVGLEIGADDYLPKPFNPRELVARIRAVLRRREADPLPPADAVRLVVGDLELVPGARTVRCAGQKVDLTSVEFAILETLLRLSGQVVSRDELVKQAMGRDFSAYDRSIDVHVSSLRRKLGPRSGEVERIKTVRSIGYLYSAEL